MLPTTHSYLEPSQEESIPKDQISFKSHKVLSAIMHESKTFLDDLVQRNLIINQKQEEIDLSLPNLREFFNDLFKIVQGFMKAL